MNEGNAPHAAARDRFDVAVIGGGIVGSSVAHFLTQLAPTMRVAVLEPDPTYEFASTLRASGGVRVLFSCPENIEMSKYGRDFIRRFPIDMPLPDREAPIDWVEGGYLFIVPPQGMPLLEANYETQREHGCEVELLSPSALKACFPSMNVDDLGGGAHSLADGWCDPNAFLQGLRRHAVASGVAYVADRVERLKVAANGVREAVLSSGHTIVADAFVNAAGAWSAQICAMVDMPLPVSPLRRFEHYFTAGNPIERLPYVKDLDRLAFRSEGVGFSGGLVDGNEPRGFNFDVDHLYFERVVWPALAHRFPPFEAAKCHRTWSGLYEQCELDGNPIIGNWPGRLDNFYVVAGFSGHGMMHAPAAGRAIAELIVHGELRSIDLSRLGYRRVIADEPYAERGIL
ncbi:MAG TPA: FAD-binding oxidoreductase [Casimicrobiaceae bacterium]|nr:FAD-binding oxidoreductase [Casimicrobiaceae bacterium]